MSRRRRVLGFRRIPTEAETEGGVSVKWDHVYCEPGRDQLWVARVPQAGVLERLVLGSDDLVAFKVLRLEITPSRAPGRILVENAPAAAFMAAQSNEPQLVTGPRFLPVKLNEPVAENAEIRLHLQNIDASTGHHVIPAYVLKLPKERRP